MFFECVFIVEKSKFVTMKKATENVRKNLELELKELINSTPTFRDTKAERAIANADHIVETYNKINWSKSSF